MEQIKNEYRTNLWQFSGQVAHLLTIGLRIKRIQ
jgi:hypothetical protein